MIYDFTYSKVTLTKAEFINWLITTMIDAGWENQSASKTNVDYYSMFSTGESGNDKIGIHIRPWVSYASYDYSTSPYGSISIKPYHTYTPNPNLTGVGTYVPSGAWGSVRVSTDFDIRTELNVYYHVNKDRIIVVTENVNPVHTLSATFFVLGKPYELAKSDEYNKSAVICSHGDYSCRSGIIDYDTYTSHHTSTFHLNPFTKMYHGDKQMAQDIVLVNGYDGLKYRVENIFHTTFNYSPVKVLTYDLSKNTYVDSEGRKFKLFSHNLTSGLTHGELRNFMIRVE